MVFRFEPEEHYGWQPNEAAKRGSFCRGRAFDGVCLNANINPQQSEAGRVDGRFGNADANLCAPLPLYPVRFRHRTKIG
jgi:hypothetical protein